MLIVGVKMSCRRAQEAHWLNPSRLERRINNNNNNTDWGRKLKVIVNNVARILVRKRPSDHVRVEVLLKKARP